MLQQYISEIFCFNIEAALISSLATDVLYRTEKPMAVIWFVNQVEKNPSSSLPEVRAEGTGFAVEWPE